MGEEIVVSRFTQAAYDQLKEVARQSPKLYLDKNLDFVSLLHANGITEYEESTPVRMNAPIKLEPVTKGPPNRADAQALGLYASFEGMTPKLATDERMWSWVTHTWLHRYSLERWRRNQSINLANYITDHWFVKHTLEGLWQYNTAARTWWIAHTASKAAGASAGAFTAQEALNDFARYAVHYHLLVSKYSFTRGPVVLAEIVRALLNEGKGMRAEKGLYALLRELNLLSGTYVLEALPRRVLRDYIVRAIERIMSDTELVADRTRVRNRRPFRCLNLGAGVQSTVLALMADQGEHGLPQPDVAIFADTGWEPPEVYEHLEWLKGQLSYRVVTVKAGDIRDNILAGVRPNNRPYLGIPAYLVNADGTHGVSRRQCTDDYKIRPIQAWLRDHLKIPAGRRAPKSIQVEMWLGITVDEIERQKDSRDEWITKRYPLIERAFSRAQLLNWFNNHYPNRYLPRSACVGCPYKGNAEWKQLKERDPASFADAVFVDRALREIPVVRDAITAKGGQAYLHNARKPLAEIDLSETTNYDDLMAQECEGVCGV